MKQKNLFILGLLLAAIFVVPASAGAQTICELNLMMCNLNRQIDAIKLGELNQIINNLNLQINQLSQPCGQPKAVYNFLTGKTCAPIVSTTTPAQLPKLKLISTDVVVVSEEIGDTATASFVFDATAIVSSLGEPRAKDFVVTIEKSGVNVGPVSSKTVIVTPDVSSVSPGGTYRINLTSTYIPQETGMYRFKISRIDWRYEKIVTQTSGLEDFKTNHVSLRGSQVIPPTQPIPTITSSNPASGAIDARTNTDSTGLLRIDTWENITLNLSSDLVTSTTGFSKSDFSVTSSNGTVSTPKAVSNGANFLKVDVPIGSSNRVRLTHIPSGWNICLGYLPGDVDGSGMVAPADQLALIDVINGIKTLPSYATDIDRSGVTNAADIIALVDGFNSGWMGKTLPACPSPVGVAPTNTQLANIANALEALKTKFNLLLGQ